MRSAPAAANVLFALILTASGHAQAGNECTTVVLHATQWAIIRAPAYRSLLD
jgi:hypothetical protein